MRDCYKFAMRENKELELVEIKIILLSLQLNITAKR